MALLDWTRVPANQYHHFHQDWMVEIARNLNGGLLPEGYFAQLEQHNGLRLNSESDSMIYARKANRLAVRHPDGSVVAIIEVVSPGNKDSKHAIQAFTRKAVNLLMEGVHLLVIDLFPPSKRDPQAIHQKIWERIRDEPYDPTADKPLTVVSYSAGATILGYIEPLAVGDVIPEMPLFLTPERYFNVHWKRHTKLTGMSFPQVSRGR